MSLYKTKVSFFDTEALKKKTYLYLFEDTCVTAVEVQAIKELSGTLKDMKVESVVPITIDSVLIDIPQEEDTLFFLGLVSYENLEKTGKFEKATVLLNAEDFTLAHALMIIESKKYHSEATIKGIAEQPFKDVFLEKDRV